MLRYLHVQAIPLVTPMASLMVRHGHFHFIPNHRVGERGAAGALEMPRA